MKAANESLDQFEDMINKRRAGREARRRARLEGRPMPVETGVPSFADLTFKVLGDVVTGLVEAGAAEQDAQKWGPFVREALVWWTTKRNHLEEFARAHRDEILGREEQIRAEYHDRERPGHSGPNCTRIAVWALRHADMRAEIDRVLPFELRDAEKLAVVLREFRVHEYEKLIPLAHGFSTSSTTAMPGVPAELSELSSALRDVARRDQADSMVLDLVSKKAAELRAQGVVEDDLARRVAGFKANCEKAVRDHFRMKGLV